MEILFLSLTVGDNTWDWTAVNTLVKLSKANVNAVHTNRSIRGFAAVNALVKNTKANINAIFAWNSDSEY